ncbi:DNA methyltransferase (plasmid) [Haloimpatiens sp. FM7330]|uniref:DNA methyltransferase n=1 Tax=Haloimpatiens sp. FM7330 TaxID=3298610 RepID=UPI003642A0AF
MKNNIENLRIERNFSVSDLAEKCGVTGSYITKIEKGKVKISATMMKKLQKIFRCDYKCIYGESLSLSSNDVTFINNKNISIHRWYPYIEGFSQGFVKKILNKFPKNVLVYDPFNGSGTTSLTCCYEGTKVVASEVNPLMRFIAETKVNAVINIITNNKINILREFSNKLNNHKKNEYKKIKVKDYINTCYINKNFFRNDIIKQIAFIKKEILHVADKDAQDVLKVCLAAIVVECSNMIRSVDLRRKKENELSKIPNNAIERYLKQLLLIINDIESYSNTNIENMEMISENSKILNSDYENKVDLVITSPPYVNGTNYFRNTKLELWILDFIENEDDLKELRVQAVTAGINNVSKRIGTIKSFNFVEKHARKLDLVARDKRIPKLVRAYFSDLDVVFGNLNRLLKDNGKIYFDIGDSQYYGIYIPVYEIIQKIAKLNGFKTESVTVVRNRKSKNGMLLSQKVIVFNKEKKKINYIRTDNNEEEYYCKAKNFMNKLPYMKEPYNKKNWGNSWHSLCSYHGKLKPSIAHFLVKLFTNKGDVVLDPLSGVGTIPFEACLQGRIGIGNDLSRLAYTVSKAKLNFVPKESVDILLQRLEKYINKNKRIYDKDSLPYKNFGFNKSIPDYFHTDTYLELLAARNFFIMKNELTNEEAIVLSALLHILHGNRPYALSRNSHSLTPYAPTGDFIYKNVIEHIKNKLKIVYKDNNFPEYKKGKMFYGDVLSLDKRLHIKVDSIITSPPFVASIKFYTHNWLRLWFAGWEPNDFKDAETRFLDSLQKNNLSIYNKFFQVCSNILKDKGKMILHLGKSNKCDMAKELSYIASPYFKEVYRADEDVSNIEKYGIKDKGGTTHHQFLFLLKK